MITIVDDGKGHSHSVQMTLNRLGCPNRVSDDPEAVLQSDGVILPGVGAFGDAMSGLALGGLRDTMWEVAHRNIPLLGLGLGMQLLFTHSEENGLHRGLNLLPGHVRRLDTNRLKIPHMGWNELAVAQPHPLFVGLDSGFVYFAHTFHVETDNREDVLAWTDYGDNVTAMVGRNHVYGMQFHPGKSGALGLGLLHNFTKICGQEMV